MKSLYVQKDLLLIFKMKLKKLLLTIFKIQILNKESIGFIIPIFKNFNMREKVRYYG